MSRFSLKDNDVSMNSDHNKGSLIQPDTSYRELFQSNPGFQNGSFADRSNIIMNRMSIMISDKSGYNPLKNDDLNIINEDPLSSQRMSGIMMTDSLVERYKRGNELLFSSNDPIDFIQNQDH